MLVVCDHRIPRVKGIPLEEIDPNIVLTTNRAHLGSVTTKISCEQWWLTTRSYGSTKQK